MAGIYDYTVQTIDGTAQALLDYKDKALVIVNVASECGLTPQYKGLQGLYERYQDRGLEVLAFPCNQFGGQEPGSNEDVKTFCTTKYGVSFPLFSKIDVNGPARNDLYELLTAINTDPEGEGDISWNFTKFIVDRHGRVIGRFSPATEIDDAAFVACVEAAL